MEIYKTIESYPNYEVSNLGNVKSLNYKMTKKEFLMKMTKEKDGYLVISLSKKNEKKKVFKIHKLVSVAFIPNPDNKPQINHINGIKTDNRVENLEWCTAKENIVHAENNNLRNSKGVKNIKSKLSDIQVNEIRKIGKTKKLKEIACFYNIGITAVCDILLNKTWKHLL